MYKNFIYKIFLSPRIIKLIAIILLDLSILFISTYLSLAIRLDEYNIFNYNDKILISIEYFLIPIIAYFLFALIFKFYSLSFRYYNLGNEILYVYPLLGLTILLLNVLFNEYFSYGSIVINVVLISSFIVISRKLISNLYFIFHSKSKVNSLIICNSKNLHKIYEYLNLDDKIFIKSIILEDLEKIDFSKYRNLRIKNINNLTQICKKYKIKSIYTDKVYENINKKLFKKVRINILQTDDLFKNLDIDVKQEFVDKYFNKSSKIKIKLHNYYKNKIILITGAGGSIGKNLFFELLNSKPKKIILVEQDELKLFNLKKEYENIKLKIKNQIDVSFKLGNLSNEVFLKKIFLDDKNIDYVLHAAAYKHVGFGEENILSFVKNNIFVTYDLAKISIANNIKKFIFISTDKAVNPKSVMGCSKSICEKMLIYLNKKHNLKNIIKIVRFGNVINSDGSVLPIFEKQILNGGPITVTHKNVTRYFMSIKNACQLVLNTIEIDKKIGIFILDMGKSYKILDIAKSMINFYFEKKNITNKPKIIFIGLQKGEKIYEELVLGKNLVKTKIKNILFANEKINLSLDYSIILFNLKKAYIKNDIDKIIYYLRNYA
jgi:FlaA1/EpsC-like NDP-sugar epimerase